MKPYFSTTGAWVQLERACPSGLFNVKLIDNNGNTLDRIRCDEYRTALEYRRAFIKIANQLKD